MHDRLQKASYNLVDQKTQKTNHFTIANTLRSFYSSNLTNDNKRKIISHYLKAIDLIQEILDIKYILKLAYEVALIHRKTSAYQSAYNILNQFSNFIKEEQWMNDYTTAKLFMMEYASVAYLVNEHEIADATMSEVLSHTKMNCEKVVVYSQKVSQYITIGKWKHQLKQVLKA